MSTKDPNLTEDAIREALAATGVFPDGVEANPATPGEWAVWSGMGHPVYSLEDVRALGERLATYDEVA